jgi:hypothetical protein
MRTSPFFGQIRGVFRAAGRCTQKKHAPADKSQAQEKTESVFQKKIDVEKHMLSTLTRLADGFGRKAVLPMTTPDSPQ